MRRERPLAAASIFPPPERYLFSKINGFSWSPLRNVFLYYSTRCSARFFFSRSSAQEGAREGELLHRELRPREGSAQVPGLQEQYVAPEVPGPALLLGGLRALFLRERCARFFFCAGIPSVLRAPPVLNTFVARQGGRATTAASARSRSDVKTQKGPGRHAAPRATFCQGFLGACSFFFRRRFRRVTGFTFPSASES